MTFFAEMVYSGSVRMSEKGIQMTYVLNQNVLFDIEEDTKAPKKVIKTAMHIGRVINRTMGDCVTDIDIKSWVLCGIPEIVMNQYTKIKNAYEKELKARQEERDKKLIKICCEFIDLYTKEINK